MRAVHIEKLESLETESFINSLRRFVARRGQPTKIFSDRGTNFVGADTELKKSLLDLSESEILSYAIKHDIEWHFNPPSASHMGGVWERVIRSIRRIMSGILTRDVKLNDEILETVYCQIEAIINSRPLTKLTDDPNDLSPLTPNHLLLSREGVCLSDESDIYRRRWRHVQFIANQFWRKRLKSYLPELQKRIK